MKTKHEKTVFVATAYCLGEFGMPTLFGRKLNKYDVGIHSTPENAETAIRTWLETTRDWELDVLGFDVVEKKLDQKENISCFESIRAYDASGNLLADSPLDEQCVKEFTGRDTEAPFKVGDIAYMNCEDHASPVLVIQTPMTKDEWFEHMELDVVGDYTDDSYTVITLDSGHEHPMTTSLFEFNEKQVKKPVLKRLENALWSEFERYADNVFSSEIKLPVDRHGLQSDWSGRKSQ